MVNPQRTLIVFLKALLCSLLFVSNQVYAQKEEEIPIYDVQISPPSPNAAKLGVYGDVSVGLFNGTLNLTVPIYEIKLPDFTLPITLGYNTSGIKVDEVATDVGLGWVLNAGGVVAASIRGIADNLPNRYIPDNISQFDPQDTTRATPGSLSSYDMAKRVIDQNYDTQQDIYYYNFANYTGKFIYSNDRTKIVQIPYSNLKIEGPTKITDAGGNVFEFYNRETSNIKEVMTYGPANPRHFNGTYTSSYMLSRILTRNGHEIKFEYETISLKYPLGLTETKYVSSSGTPSGQCPLLSTKDRKYTNINNIAQQRLKRIAVDSSDIIVNFTYDTATREDLAYENIQYGNRLKSVEVLSNQKSIKKVTLIHDYFRSTSDLSNLSIDDKALNSRLKLLSVYEEGKGAYVFTYKENRIPARLSFAQDEWGYHNSQGQNRTLIPADLYPNGTGAVRKGSMTGRDAWMISSITYPTGGSSSFVFEPHVAWEQVKYTVKLVKELFYFRTSKALETKTFYVDGSYPYGHLSYFLASTSTERTHATITTPAGNSFTLRESGQTNYQFSQGNYQVQIVNGIIDEFKDVMATADVDSTYYVWEHVPVGGVRIAKVSDIDLSGKVINTYYNYNLPDTNISSASYSHAPPYSVNSYATRKLVDGAPQICDYLVLSSSSYPELGTEGPEEAVGYKYVTVTKDSAVAWGRVRNKFSTGKNDLLGDIKTNASLDWCRGLNLEVSNERYDAVEDKWYPVEKKINYYRTNFNPIDYDTPRYVNEHESIVPNYSLAYSMPELTSGVTMLPATFLYNVFRYVSGWVRLDSTITISYSGDGGATLQQNWKYNYANYAHVQPTEILSADSKGALTANRLLYPHNFVGDPVYDTMIKRNYITPIVEQDIYKAGKLIKTSINSFGLFNANNLALPAIIKQKNGDNAIEIRARFYKYDKKGNLLEASNENDVHYSYLWGYNDNYVVASVTGSDFNTVSSFILNEGILSAPATDDQLRNELTKIRIGLLGSKALVKTYTYSPLIGMTSETDPSGKTIFYEYDSFGRLKLIKDQYGKILKQFNYQYQQPVTQ